jgi:hypothetical protein
MLCAVLGPQVVPLKGSLRLFALRGLLRNIAAKAPRYTVFALASFLRPGRKTSRDLHEAVEKIANEGAAILKQLLGVF